MSLLRLEPSNVGGEGGGGTIPSEQHQYIQQLEIGTDITKKLSVRQHKRLLRAVLTVFVSKSSIVARHQIKIGITTPLSNIVVCVMSCKKYVVVAAGSSLTEYQEMETLTINIISWHQGIAGGHHKNIIRVIFQKK